MGKLTIQEKKLLKKVYYDAKHPGSYSSPQKLYESLDKKISLSKIKHFLKGEDTYSLHRNIRRKFKKNAVIAPFIDYQYDMDTANMKFYEKYNEYVHILFVIDIFSRYLWTFPLKTLRGNEIATILTKLFAERSPMKVRTDGGSEFVNKEVKNVLKSMNIDHIITKNETKANYAERVIRTIRDKMGRYLEEKQTNKWDGILSQMTKSYNHTPHRTIGMRPINVNKSNENELWSKQFSSVPSQSNSKIFPPKSRKIRYKFKLGETVRLSTFKMAFEKTAFSHRWTTETFVIRKRYINQGKPLYEVNDYMGDEVVGTFYEAELQSVIVGENKEYKVEKIIKKRKIKGGKTEYFVKFKGWPKKYNTWVTDIKNLEK